MYTENIKDLENLKAFVIEPAYLVEPDHLRWGFRDIFREI